MTTANENYMMSELAAIRITLEAFQMMLERLLVPQAQQTAIMQGRMTKEQLIADSRAAKEESKRRMKLRGASKLSC